MNSADKHRQPWLAGIFAGSLFLVGLNWLFTVFPNTTFRAGRWHPPSSPHQWAMLTW